MTIAAFLVIIVTLLANIWAACYLCVRQYHNPNGYLDEWFGVVLIGDLLLFGMFCFYLIEGVTRAS